MYAQKLGNDFDFTIAEPLDTWLTAGAHDYAVPEAGGSSARVFKLKSKRLMGDVHRDTAIKVMRHDKIDYAKPLFLQEINILRTLDGHPGLTPMIKTGFLNLSPGSKWPAEIAPLTKLLELKASASGLSGELVIFDLNETDQMLSEFEQRIQEEWLPFIVLERRWEDNLYLLCDAGYTRGDFLKNLSVQEVITIAIQITELLSFAHDKGVVYFDHKLLHYYWNDIRKQVFMIDWNIGRLTSDVPSIESQQFDLLQFSSRAMHHLFTGRQAPGSVAVGANKPEDIENSPRHYKASYPYDVQKRLNREEITFLERSLDGGFSSALEMHDALGKLILKRL
ncbi:MAG: hypothetical protein MUO40_10020 [Anaerolineaceae bacterium]|nr:hypothetical protein [Anaerolineaceae bacterium]